MPQLVPPHGSEQPLPLLLPEAERAEEIRHAETLPKIPLSSREVSDLFMLGWVPTRRSKVSWAKLIGVALLSI